MGKIKTVFDEAVSSPQEKKCDIRDIGCGNANCKDCDTKTLAKESGVSSPQEKKCINHGMGRTICNKNTCDGVPFEHTSHCIVCKEAIPNDVENSNIQKCEHPQFWKDGNPPECWNCGKSKLDHVDFKEIVSSPSWETREREAFANWLNEPSVMPRSEIELENYLISRISVVREEIAIAIESLPDTSLERESDEYDLGLKNMKKVAAQIARGSTK